MLAEQLFGPWPRDAGTELGLAGYLVEVQQLVEASQIQRHHRAELAAEGIESADHTGSAAERDDGDAVLEQYRRIAATSSSVPGSSTASGAS